MNNRGMLNSYVTAELTSADISGLLRLLNGSGIPFFGIEQRDSLTVLVKVARSDVRLLQYLAERAGATLSIITVSGPVYWVKGLLGRPLLVIGMLLLIALVIWLPTRVLFIAVDGNQNLPTSRVLEEAARCGIVFGASRREVRSEIMKNTLLEALPELQWAGINTSGCTAVISVKERSSEQYSLPDHCVSSIVAARDGVIESCISSKGDLLCKPGQAVKKGDVLISGYTDCGIKITADRAEGEIFAKTAYEFSVVTPTDYQQKGAVVRKVRNFGLLIGKKRINFYKGSGISGGSCDKMYSKYVLSLPGGFSLPVALLKETTISCYLTESAVNQPESMLEAFASNYLKGQMQNGTILRKDETVTESDGVFRLDGVYDCRENIGIVQEEKIGEFNG